MAAFHARGRSDGLGRRGGPAARERLIVAESEGRVDRQARHGHTYRPALAVNEPAPSRRSGAAQVAITWSQRRSSGRRVDSVLSAYERGGTERVPHGARATIRGRRRFWTVLMRRCHPTRRGKAHSAGDHRRRRTTTTARSDSRGGPRRNTSRSVLHPRSEMLRSLYLREGKTQSTLPSVFPLWISTRPSARRWYARLQSGLLGAWGRCEQPVGAIRYRAVR